MPPDHAAVFAELRDILRAHATRFTVTDDSATRYCLMAPVGPASIAAWRGEVRHSTIPVGWVQRGKAYVGYHLMGLYGNSTLISGLSPALRARLHGKTCFNFIRPDQLVPAEPEALTATSIDTLLRAGFIMR